MRALPLLAVAAALGLATSAAAHKEKKTAPAESDSPRSEAKAEAKRDKIDAKATATLEELLAKSPRAKELYATAAGYAVFDNTKVSLGLTGGGGGGVAVDKPTGKRTYMKMGTAGVNVGLGVQNYRVVFLFETQSAFDQFVQKGWEAESSATAAAGTAGANAEATFRNGVAVFQFTDAGLMLQADISGTKYWQNENLN